MTRKYVVTLEDTLKGWQEDEDELERKYGAEPLDCGNCEIVQASINTGIRTASKLVDDVLDKIRAEIAEYGSICVAYAITDKTKTDKGIEKLVSDVLKQAKEQVLEVIDKYREEQTDAT